MFPEGRLVEFLIAAIVALIVVGPKDLPILLRKLGQFMAKVRGMAAEFRASFDEMARQSELDELRKEVEAMRQGQLADMATHAPEVNQAFDEISQGLSDVGVQLNAPAIPTSAPDRPSRTTPPRRRPASARPPARKRAGQGRRAKKAAAPKVAAKAAGDAEACRKPKAPRQGAAAERRAAKAAPAKPRARKATAS